MSYAPQSERTNARRRLIAPDAARGLTLLGIACANGVTTWLAADGGLGDHGYTSTSVLGAVVNDSIIDKIAIALTAFFFNVRGLPMFTTLLGYGLGMISLSLMRRYYPRSAAMKTIAKRYGLLAVFGILHMVFLYFGDIMFFYGVFGVLLALLIGLRDKWLLWIAAGLAALSVLVMVVLPIVGMWFATQSGGAEHLDMSVNANGPSFSAKTYGEQLAWSPLVVGSQSIGVFFAAPQLFPLVLIGFVAARRRIMDNVDQYRKVLWGAVIIAVVIGIATGATATALSLSGEDVVDRMASGDAEALVPMSLFFVVEWAGTWTGPGILAAIVLAAEPFQRRLNRAAEEGVDPQTLIPGWLKPICALGRRSMTGYIAQSILFSILVTRFGLGFGRDQGAAVALAWSAGVWVLTLIICYGLELAGKPGPFEALHRRLSYGKKGLQQRWEPTEKQLEKMRKKAAKRNRIPSQPYPEHVPAFEGQQPYPGQQPPQGQQVPQGPQAPHGQPHYPGQEPYPGQQPPQGYQPPQGQQPPQGYQPPNQP